MHGAGTVITAEIMEVSFTHHIHWQILQQAGNIAEQSSDALSEIVNKEHEPFTNMKQ